MCIRSKLLAGMLSICTVAVLLTGCGSSAPSETKDIVQEEKAEGESESTTNQNDESEEEEEFYAIPPLPSSSFLPPSDQFL